MRYLFVEVINIIKLISVIYIWNRLWGFDSINLPLNIVIPSSIINIGVLEEIKQGYDELVKVWPSEAYFWYRYWRSE